MSIWLMAVKTRGERNERLAKAAAASRKVSGHFVDRQRSVREATRWKAFSVTPKM